MLVIAGKKKNYLFAEVQWLNYVPPCEKTHKFTCLHKPNFATVDFYTFAFTDFNIFETTHPLSAIDHYKSPIMLTRNTALLSQLMLCEYSCKSRQIGKCDRFAPNYTCNSQSLIALHWPGVHWPVVPRPGELSRLYHWCRLQLEWYNSENWVICKVGWNKYGDSQLGWGLGPLERPHKLKQFHCQIWKQPFNFSE